MIQFDLPKEQSSIIKVIGVGGGGSNAVNHMFSQNIEGVNFVICNTDAQALAQSYVPNKIQLGPYLTQGLGAGANPTIGRRAMEESLEEIRNILEVNTKMAFITAGMGGGTGTGGAPILARICKDLGILTVGIVTTPFTYEGKKRYTHALEGIRELQNHVDTLLVISNDKLRHQFGNLKMKDAFAKADNVLATAAKCITDVINSTGQINVDFADVCTVMSNGGSAILGSATASGENRAQMAIENALTSPLLDDNDIKGAKWILININSAEGEYEFTMDEVEVIQNYLISQAGEDTDVILGLGYDNNLGNEIGITIIATGFEPKDPMGPETKKTEFKLPSKVTVPLQSTAAVAPAPKPEVSAEVKAPVPDVSTFRMPVEEPLIPKELIPHVVDLTQPAEPAKTEEGPLYFELSVDNTEIAGATADQTYNEDLFDESAETSPLSSGGYLVKPSQIYAEGYRETESDAKSRETSKVQEDEPVVEMHLVVKTQKAAEETPSVQQTQPIMMSSFEEPAMQDEGEELRRRAMDRIAKLRNLSFNINTADPNNEFETVPAYLRRNMDINSQTSHVESFYSNYSVKKNENDQIEVSGLNNFLDGKKPD